MVGRTPKGEATRGDILNAAARVFARSGYAGARMDEIIRESGLTKGAIYFYFPSKRDLALAVINADKARWLARVQEEVSPSLGAVEQLRAIGRLLIAMSDGEESTWAIVHLANQVRHELPAEQLRDISDPILGWVELISDMISRGQTEGVFCADVDPEDAAVIVVGAFDGLKNMSDTLSGGGGGGGGGFERRAAVLMLAIEASLRA